MRRIFLFLSILLISILSSCTKDGYDDLENDVSLDYKGSNDVGKLLVSKITEREQGTKELNQIVSLPERELLFDYAIFGQGFGFGIHYAVPVRNIKTGMVEGCIIYQVNKTSSDNFDLKGKVEAPQLIDVEKYKELPISQTGCYVFFKKWKEQGLEVTTELYMPDKCFSRTVTENKEEIQVFSTLAVYFIVEIQYWIDLRGYIPGGANAYAIGLEERRRIFYQHRSALEISNLTSSPGIIVDMEMIEIILPIYKGNLNQSEFYDAIEDYLNKCVRSFSNCPGSPDLYYNIVSILGNSGSSSGSSGGSGTGTTPGGGGGSWNAKTHHGILEALKAELNLDDSELEMLVDANDYCDNLLLGNQFSIKAYYHAMKTSKNLSEVAARNRFKRHLEDYLSRYIADKTDYHLDAIFELGIAIHGIVDSFCPGHKGFQYYSLANFSEHANQDKGELSQNQVYNSMNIVIRIYSELNSPDATEETVNKVIGMWEDAYNRNLEENN